MRENRYCCICGRAESPHARLVEVYASDATEMPVATPCITCLLAEIAATLKTQARPYETNENREMRAAIARATNLTIKANTAEASSAARGQMNLPAIEVPNGAETPQAYTI